MAVRSKRNTSTTKRMAAKGALKMPAMAPAAPQPSSRRTFLGLSRSQRPMLLPMADPVEAIGASRPTLPPKATVMVEATSDVHMFLAGSSELLRLMARSTEGSPWPMSPRTTYLTKSTVSSMPMTGSRKIIRDECWNSADESAGSCDTMRLLWYTSVLSTTAARPLSRPTTTARSMTSTGSLIWCRRHRYIFVDRLMFF